MTSKFRKRGPILLSLAVSATVFACNIVGPSAGSSQAFDPTKAALEIQATSLALQMTEASMNLQASGPQSGTPPPFSTPMASIVSPRSALRVCSDMPYFAMEFFDANGNPAGLDIDISREIATRLGLQLMLAKVPFDALIDSANGGKCDIIVSAMNITADRKKQISFIPYFQGGQSMIATTGNPQNINSPADLCAKSAAAVTGYGASDYLHGVNSYAGTGLPAICIAAGKPAVNVVITQTDADALQQLRSGAVAAFFIDTPVAAYYVVQHPDQFQLVGQVIDPILVGIGVPCSQSDCTDAPLTPLGEKIQTALKSMMADGVYAKILAKWDLLSGAVTLP